MKNKKHKCQEPTWNCDCGNQYGIKECPHCSEKEHIHKLKREGKE